MTFSLAFLVCLVRLSRGTLRHTKRVKDFILVHMYRINVYCDRLHVVQNKLKFPFLSNARFLNNVIARYFLVLSWRGALRDPLTL